MTMLVRLCVVATLVAGTTALGAPATVVTVDTGALQGVAQGDVISFKGIPFAQPPVGTLSWKPPQFQLPVGAVFQKAIVQSGAGRVGMRPARPLSGHPLCV